MSEPTETENGGVVIPAPPHSIDQNPAAMYPTPDQRCASIANSGLRCMRSADQSCRLCNRPFCDSHAPRHVNVTSVSPTITCDGEYDVSDASDE